MLNMVANLAFCEHTKHIEIDCHVIHERIQVDLVHIAYIQIKDQLIDAFIKTLRVNVFPSLIHKWVFVPPYFNLKESIIEYFVFVHL